MSNQIFWRQVCSSEQSILLKVQGFCIQSETTEVSPIDELIRYFKEVLPLGSPDTLGKNQVLGRALLLGLVSGSEMYFRSLLARLIAVCPLARGHAADSMLSLAAVDYYEKESIGFGLLENTSFSSEGELLKATKKLTGISWDVNGSSLAEAVAQFECLSHFRHAAVHARGELGPRNAKALGVSRNSRQCLRVEFIELQHAAEICLNAARAYNRFMFQKVVESWLAAKRFNGNRRHDRAEFSRVLQLFRSREDSGDGAVNSKGLFLSLRPAIASSLRPPAPRIRKKV